MRTLKKLNKKTFGLLLCVVIYICTPALGQSYQAAFTKDVIIPPAPNAASLGKYGEIPISTYTGIPNISIPLYKIKTKSHALDISLSYHAGGVRVEEEASWVGLGWSLNAGGVITRSIRGIDDFSSTPEGYPIAPAFSTPNTTNNYPYNPQTSQPCTQNYISEVARGRYDTEPDIFYFNFAGRTGSFIIDRFAPGFNGGNVPYTIKLLSDAAIRIQRTYGQDSWTITTEDGVQYIFETSTSETTTSHSSTQTSNGGYATIPSAMRTATSAWYITRIITTDNERIDFEYMRQPSTQNIVSVSNADNYWTGDTRPEFSMSQGTGCGNAPTLWGAGNQERTELYITNNQPLILHKINFATGSILFEKSDREDLQGESNNTPRYGLKIDKIKVLRRDRSLEREIEFSQSYFNSNSTRTAVEKRLKLDAITERINTGNHATYRFEYIGSGSLPAKNSRDRDYWGFFNNAGNGPYSKLFPAVVGAISPVSGRIINLPADGSQEPDSSAVKLGALEKIIYPTKGWSRFIYSSNTYSNFDAVNSDKIGGGLRIRKIETSAGNSSPLQVQAYAYTKPDQAQQHIRRSSGRLMTVPQYYYFEVIPRAQQCGSSTYGSQVNWYYSLVRTSASCTPLGSSAAGKPLGYDIVTLYEGNRGENGKIEYTYRNHEEIVSQEPFIPNTPNSIPIGNGQLLSKFIYRKVNANFQLTASIENTYTNTIIGTSTKGMKINPYILFQVDPSISDAFTFCHLYPYQIKYYDNFAIWEKLTSTIEKSYDQNNANIFKQTVTNFTYGNNTHKQPTLIESILSDLSVVRKYTKFPADYLGVSGISSGPVYEMATAKNIQIVPVEQYETLQQSGGGEVVTKGNFTHYSYVGSQYALVKPHQIDVLQLESPISLSNFIPSSSSLQPDSRYYKPVQVFSYDALTGNLEKSNKPYQPTDSYQWGYDNQLLTAVFTNAVHLPPTATPQLGNECSYLGFESGRSGIVNIAEDQWQNSTDAVDYLIKDAHTGNWAWRVGPVGAWAANYGPTKVFSPDKQRGKYKLSAWVKTENGFTAGSGLLVISVNRENGVHANVASAYESTPFDATNGQWQYIEVLVDLDAVRSAAAVPVNERLQLVAYCMNAGRSTPNLAGFRIDDLRFHPVDAAVTTYTYEPTSRRPTSFSDVNSIPTFYEYDDVGRLKLARDFKGNIIKYYDYHYQQ